MGRIEAQVAERTRKLSDLRGQTVDSLMWYVAKSNEATKEYAETINNLNEALDSKLKEIMDEAEKLQLLSAPGGKSDALLQ